VTHAPDGSPVDLYLHLPPLGEADRIHALIDAGSEILELGCGVGRVTHELLRLGHPVTAVDESPEMLAHVRGAETIQSHIEELELGHRYPCVLLMSNLVNVTDDRLRRAFLQTCARHVASDGMILIERHEPDWHPTPGTRTERAGVAFALEDVRIEQSLVTATVRYEADGRTWCHPFAARLLDDEQLDSELAAVGLRLTRTLDDRGAWVEARIYSGA
jgi:SAM-dependent methyltransferase